MGQLKRYTVRVKATGTATIHAETKRAAKVQAQLGVFTTTSLGRPYAEVSSLREEAR